ncbi:DUF2842 domain-containing protein [Devosia sp.]|uniref:DUF2842 domain-containing protein n=1 Tax=Devosia sp. TaxID=1871048 RepID=UPI001AD546AB|nr:DUF2842 domain-containing protein [Devosia sp.]MBN9334021.1 DUF2842 domain-containing protein [Devosia sp.]
MPHMTQRTRKLIGALLCVISIVVWASLATSVYLAFPPELPWFVLIGYFIVAGMGWCLPAGLIIRWMAKPDPQG